MSGGPPEEVSPRVAKLAEEAAATERRLASRLGSTAVHAGALRAIQFAVDSPSIEPMFMQQDEPPPSPASPDQQRPQQQSAPLSAVPPPPAAAQAPLITTSAMERQIERHRLGQPAKRDDQSRLAQDRAYLVEQVGLYQVRDGVPRHVIVGDGAYSRLSSFAAEHQISRAKLMTFLLDVFLPLPLKAHAADAAKAMEIALIPSLLAKEIALPDWLPAAWPKVPRLPKSVPRRILTTQDPYIEWRLADLTQCGGTRNDFAERLILHVFPEPPKTRIALRHVRR